MFHLDPLSLVMLVILAAGIILVVMSLRVVPENKRLLRTRRGSERSVLGPGIVLSIPGLDRSEAIDLDQEYPNWRSMSARNLEGMILGSHKGNGR